jgi:hypothetical protein
MRRFVSIEALFTGRHFDREVIILCVSWYTSFKLSFRDLVTMMANRGVSLAHTTILRWVQHYLPEFEKRWKRYARPVGGSWRMDETYIRVHGQWVYLCPPAERQSRKRAVNAAKGFLRRAMKNTRKPTKITRLCGITSGGAGDEGRWRTSAASEGPIQPILEQLDRTGSQVGEATDPAHARLQTVRQCSGHHTGNRVGGEDQEGGSSRQGCEFSGVGVPVLSIA